MHLVLFSLLACFPFQLWNCIHRQPFCWHINLLSVLFHFSKNGNKKKPRGRERETGGEEKKWRDYTGNNRLNITGRFSPSWKNEKMPHQRQVATILWLGASCQDGEDWGRGKRPSASNSGPLSLSLAHLLGVSLWGQAIDAHSRLCCCRWRGNHSLRVY